MARETSAESCMNYARCPEGWFLAHNPVRVIHPEQSHGVNGFRRFWISPKEKRQGWHICKCGWRPDAGPHYSKLPK